MAQVILVVADTAGGDYLLPVASISSGLTVDVDLGQNLGGGALLHLEIPDLTVFGPDLDADGKIYFHVGSGEPDSTTIRNSNGVGFSVDNETGDVVDDFNWVVSSDSPIADDVTVTANYTAVAPVPKCIDPATGNDSNSGDESAPWATMEHAATYINANVGAVSTLYIDTSGAPLYITTTNPDFSTSGAGLSITSATSDKADIRFWQLIQGSTAVPYDTYYSTSGHPNIWVLVTRQDACIWEFMGGRGDNLKWFDHLVNCGISPSATYNNATNLSTLNSTPWSWWTGTDGSHYVTLFNPNGSPAGRQFAVPYRPGQGTGGDCFTKSGTGTISNLCLGGFSGCGPTGSGLAGTVLVVFNGATVDGNVLYGGASHLAIFGAGNSVTALNNVYREGPRWMGAGGYTTTVWYSETSTTQPTFTNESCQYIASVAGSVRGSNFFSGATLGLYSELGVAFFAHGAGVDTWTAGLGTTTSEVVMTNCYFGGGIAIPVAATGCTLGSITNSGVVQSCTLLYCPVSHTADVGRALTIKDSVILLNLTGTNSSHLPRAFGTLTLQSCTIVEQTYLTGFSLRSVFYAGLGALALTMNDCIAVLSSAVISYELNLDDTDTLTANRNIYIAASAAVIHNSLTKSSTRADRTLAQLQSISKEAGSISDPSNALTKLAGFYVPRTSVANEFAARRIDAPDRSGAIYPTRVTAGAYEARNLPADAGQHGPRSTFNKLIQELILEEYDPRQSRNQGTFQQTSGATASYKIGQTLWKFGNTYFPADSAKCDAVLIQNLVNVPTATDVPRVALLVAGPVVIEQEELEFVTGADQAAQIAALLAKRIRCVNRPASFTRAGG